jgi:hypothetical protein
VPPPSSKTQESVRKALLAINASNIWERTTAGALLGAPPCNARPNRRSVVLSAERS